MPKLRRIVVWTGACAALGLLVVEIVGSGVSATPRGPSSLEVVGTHDGGAFVDVGDRGHGLGDYRLFREVLRDPAGTVVGSDRGICWNHVGGRMCQISFSITDHGLIEAEGFIAPGDDPPTLTILGGTLEYDGVGGRLFVGSGQHPRYTFHFA
jgi:hypothetical protein